MRSTQGKLFLDEPDQELLRVIGDNHPETLEKAVELARLRSSESDEVVMKRVLRLESGGKISFEKPSFIVPSSLTRYFFSESVFWYWSVLGLAVVSSVMVFVVPEGAFPLVYLRYLFGSVFVLFLPGYSLIRALFGSKELDYVERFALSVGLSLALVPLTGLLLNYTLWGVRTEPVTFCLLGLTLAFASAAVLRDYSARNRIVSA